MKIYKNDFNTMPMQVEENKKNIELIASIIKDAYHSTLPLLTTDVSVAISVTNADATTTDGWLIDPKGKIFKITGGDGTNLLIEFYSDISGEKGYRGFSIHYSSYDYVNGSYTYPYSSLNNITDLQQNDVIVFKNGYVATLYSYDKPLTFTIDNSNIIQLDIQMEGKTTNIYISSSQATYDSGTYSFLIPITSIRKLDGSSFSVDDFDENADNLIYYIDMSSMDPQDVKLKAIYNFRGIDTISTPNNAICNIEMLVGDSGEQKYQHNICLVKEGSRYYDYLFIDNIVNNNPNDLIYSDIISFLGDNGYIYDSGKPTYRQNEYNMRGWEYDSNSSNYTWYVGVMKETNTEIRTHTQTGSGTIDISSGWTIIDKIIPL